MSRAPNPVPIAVGTVVAPHGLDGRVRVYPTTDYPERLLRRPWVRVAALDGRRVAVEAAAPMNSLVLLKLAGIDDRNAAERLRGSALFVYADELPPLPEGEYYWFQLTGLTVREEAHPDQPVGTVEGIVRNGAGQDLLEIRPARGSPFLLPIRREFVQRIDLEQGAIVCRIPDGLREPPEPASPRTGGGQ